MFRAGSTNVARAVAASTSKKAAFTTSAARNAPIRVGINGFGRIGRLVRAGATGTGLEDGVMDGV
jgi:phosphoglycerate dehydrogenase-like enzyme